MSWPATWTVPTRPSSRAPSSATRWPPPVRSDDAVRVLDDRGLACLGDRWVLTRDDGERVDVLIMSAYADRVEVVETEYGGYGPDSPRHTLTAPTGDRLTRAR